MSADSAPAAAVEGSGVAVTPAVVPGAGHRWPAGQSAGSTDRGVAAR